MIKMKDVIKIVIAVCLLVFSVQIVNAQQVFISQDFEDPFAVDWTWNEVVPFLGTVSSTNNTFVVNNVYLGGFVEYDPFLSPEIATTADQGYQPNSNYLHTVSFNALNGSLAFAPVQNTNYIDQFVDGVNQELICAVTPDYSTIGFDNVDLEFQWISGSSETSFGTEVYYSLDQGITWILIDGPLVADNTNWQLASYDFGTTIDNQPNVRFAFVFNNEMEDNILTPLPQWNQGVGFGLDDFRLIADCDSSFLPEDYTVCSGESTTIFADTTWFDNFVWTTGSIVDSTSLIINNDEEIIAIASNDYCNDIPDTINVFVQTERADLGLTINGEVNGVGIPCHGDCNGELQLEVINGTPESNGAYTVQWMDSLMNPINDNVNNELLNNFTSTLSLVCEGTYFVSVLDAICTIPEIDSITITSNVPIENVFTSDSVSCFNGSDGVISSSPSGGLAPYTFDWGLYGNEASIDSLPIGTYTVVITDSLGCSEDFSIGIFQPGKLLVDPYIYKEISCYDSSNAVLSTFVYGGTGNPDFFTYVWSHPNYPWVDDPPYHKDTLGPLPFSVGADDLEVNPNYQTYSDPYTLSVTDENGCISSAEIYVLEPPKLNVFLTQPTKPAYCNNNILGFNTGWAQVSASGGTPNQNGNYNFIWSALGQNNENTLYSTLDNMNAGIYDVTVVDSLECAEQMSVEIELETTWQSFTSTTPASCFNEPEGSASITMEGGCGDIDNSCGFSYLWNGGLATGNILPTVTGIQQGVYSVTVTDDFGCEGVYNLIVDGPTKAEFQVTNLIDQSCVGDNGSSDDGEAVVEIVGGVSPYHVKWLNANPLFSDSAYTNGILNINGLTAGDWEIQIEYNDSCPVTHNISSLHPNPFTIDDGIQVTAQINTNNTFLTDTIECFGASNAMASVLNANPSFEYDWHLQGSSIVIDEGTTTNELPAGNIQVTASYLLGLCVATSPPVTIEERLPFFLTDNSSTPSCNGDEDAQISISVTGASPYLNDDQLSDYNFSWFPSNLNDYLPLNTDGSLDIQIPGLDGGTYYIEVLDRYGCDTVFSIIIEDPSLLTASVTSQNLNCHEQNGSLSGQILIGPSGGTSPYTYEISNTSPSNNPNFIGLAAGTYDVIAIDANGCRDSSQIILSQPPQMTMDYSIQDLSCDDSDDGSVSIIANGGTQPYDLYTIAGPSNFSNGNGVFTNLVAGSYTLSVEDNNGCTVTENTVELDSPPPYSNFQLDPTDPTCHDGQDGFITLSLQGGTRPYTYNWSNGENTQNIDFLSAGNYTVTVTDENGCLITGSETLNNPVQVVADWIIATPGADGNHFILSQPAPFNVEFIDVSQNSEPAFNQWWINNQNSTQNFYQGYSFYYQDTTKQYTFYDVGDYDVVMEVFDSLGNCSDTISLTISVQGIVEYNAFSPNGDNINDNFYFESYGIKDLNAIIYNRWGDKIYEILSPDDSWDGVSLNGLDVPEGVYFYVLNATGQDGTPYKEKGSVTLYR